MNEIVGFCDGTCEIEKKHNITEFDPNHPPYVPGGDKLYSNTIYLDSKTHASIEYDTHSLYGHMESEGKIFVLLSSSFVSNEKCFREGIAKACSCGFKKYFCKHWKTSIPLVV